jgi:4-carboxymuconolactone decarboxylase
MRLDTPRIPPVGETRTDDQQTLLEPYERAAGGVLNIYGTLANKPDAARSFLTWGAYVLRRSSIDARLRELAILRIGWRCRSGYEWMQHSRLGLTVGLTADEIERIKGSASDPAWSAIERAILTAADEVVDDRFVSNATWTRLGEGLSDEERMDLVFVLAHYVQVSIILNSFGIQAEPGGTIDPDLRVTA